MRSSSHIPLVAAAPFLTPYNVGMALFMLFNVILGWSQFRFLRRRYLAGEHTLPPEVLLNFVLHLALVNLAFNVLLTGTHERYLYHFYPYILLAWAGLRQYSRHFSTAMSFILIFGSILYGAFVLGVLSGEITFQRVTLAHQITALFHAGLLGYLSCITLKYQSSSTFIRA